MNIIEKNLLGAGGSPYLHQRAHNPCHWQPSPPANPCAREGNRPTHLAVDRLRLPPVPRHGVENSAIAGLMNDLLVNIKVDRKERRTSTKSTWRGCVPQARKAAGR